MSQSYKQDFNNGSETHFSASLSGSPERSRMTANPVHLTTFNAGELVPIYCREVLPRETVSIDFEAVIRQSTLLTPTMGRMMADVYAFFVPNRVVNESTKAVFGENLSGSWNANPVSYAPLLRENYPAASNISVPVGSVADYYGFPTQFSLNSGVLKLCHDLKFRGYIEIYNQYFRDQNYQPPIPYSKLNVYEGFFEYGSDIPLNGSSFSSAVSTLEKPDGSYPDGAVLNALYGDGSSRASSSVSGPLYLGGFSVGSTFNALGKPLKVNKLHDYFTSVLPSPQKAAGPVFLPLSGSLPVKTSSTNYAFNSLGDAPLAFYNRATGNLATNGSVGIGATSGFLHANTTAPGQQSQLLEPANLYADAAGVTAFDINSFRLAVATQQIYEQLARSGSRYREYCRAFFGIEVDDPYKDIPEYLGHIRRDLDLYQTAQTSASVEGGTAQGNLAAFGYTSTGGHLFTRTFYEHGYIHIFVVVRHKNIYPTYFAPDNFRRNMLDFYQPQLANIGEQPVWTRYINPFVSIQEGNDTFGYQEAWAEYRYEPDVVSGYMRSGIPESLSVWNYADEASATLVIADGEFMRSNSEVVLNRSLAVSSAVAPQFKAQFVFSVDKELPMPTYSVPGLDIV